MPQAPSQTLSWEKHENEILDLFVTQNKTLAEVRACMRVKYNFDATQAQPFEPNVLGSIRLTSSYWHSERQYKYKFPRLKNIKANEWRWIGQEIQRRAALGKPSQPCLHRRPLPLERVDRELRRHTRGRGNRVRHPVNPSPGRIAVRTPPPIGPIIPLTESSGRRNDGNPLAFIPGDVSNAFPGSAETSPFPRAGSAVGTAKHMATFQSDTADSPDIGLQHLARIDSTTSFEFASSQIDIDFSPTNPASPAGFGRSATFDAGNDPSLFVRDPNPLFPVGQLPNPQAFNFRPASQLLDNLPWFQM